MDDPNDRAQPLTNLAWACTRQETVLYSFLLVPGIRTRDDNPTQHSDDFLLVIAFPRSAACLLCQTVFQRTVSVTRIIRCSCPGCRS